ncbi:MAG: hypothetical protein Ct9H300mP14_14990 [Gammaproteobacteria bacterium]|nr:MAG: hypothetical protein Ct9H300mP14_14990 [Gammaproteobacteria bacterium]
MGFGAGVLIPEEHGGVAMGHVAAGVIAEEMGRTLTASPFLSTAVMGAVAIAKMARQVSVTHGFPRLQMVR